MIRLRHLPNALSLARLLLVPFTLWLIAKEHWDWAFYMFVGAGITDAVDGALARLLNAQSVFGSWLDPLADKVLVVCIYLSLVIMGFLPLWLVVLVALRDVMIVLYAVTDILNGVDPGHPLLISKVNTLAQIILASLVLARLGFGLGSEMIIEAFVIVVALTTTASGAAYLVKVRR